MSQREAKIERPPSDCTEIAGMLLVLQGGFGLLSALGLLVFALVSRSAAALGGMELLSFAGSAVAFALAAGLVGRRRWARTGALAFEGVTLLGAVLRLLVSTGATAALVPVLTTMLLPIAIIVLATRR